MGFESVTAGPASRRLGSVLAALSARGAMARTGYYLLAGAGAACACAVAAECRRSAAAARAQRLLLLGERLFTEREGSALSELREELPGLGSTLRALSELDRVRLLFALGPAFWMVGLSREGLELAQSECPPSAGGDGAEPGFGGELEREIELPLPLAPLPRAALDPEAHLVGVSPFLLVAGVLDGAGANAYACTEYSTAALCHGQALEIANLFLADGTSQPELRRQLFDGNRQTTAKFWEAGVECGVAEAHVMRSRALDGLGRVARESGDYDRSLRLHAAAARAAIAAHTAVGDGSVLRVRPQPLVAGANAVSNAGVAAYRLGEHGLARRYHTEALRLRELCAEQRGISSTLGNLALVSEGPDAALPLYQRSLAIRLELRDTWGVAGSHRSIAVQHIERGAEGDAAKARQHLAMAVPIFAEVNDALGVAECLESLGLLEAAGNPTLAARLLGAAVGVRRGAGAATDVVLGHEEAAGLRVAERREWPAGEAMDVPNALRLVATIS